MISLNASNTIIFDQYVKRFLTDVNECTDNTDCTNTESLHFCSSFLIPNTQAKCFMKEDQFCLSLIVLWLEFRRKFYTCQVGLESKRREKATQRPAIRTIKTSHIWNRSEILHWAHWIKTGRKMTKLDMIQNHIPNFEMHNIFTFSNIWIERISTRRWLP